MRGQQLQPVVQPPHQRRQRQHIQPSGGQLQRQRQPIQLRDQLGHQRRLPLADDEVGPSRPRPVDEERHRWDGEQRVQRLRRGGQVGDRQGRDAQRPLPAQLQRHPAGDQQGHAGTGN